MFAKIALVYRIIKAVYGFIKEVERRGAERLSDQNAHRDRLRLEAWLYDLTSGNEKGWRAFTELDDDLLRYGQILMKSSKLQEIHQNTNSDEVEKAMMAFASVRDMGPEK
jgi:hypothetical protein